MDNLLKFHEERRNGLYAGCSYPNLVEIYEYFPTSYFAEVTSELMLAVFLGEEDLTLGEMSRIARYNGIPFSALVCPHLITLDRGRWKHRQMIKRLHEKLFTIWELQKKGSQYAKRYMYRYGAAGRCDYVNMDLAFWDGRIVTYGHYLGVNHAMDDTILFASGEFRKAPRGLANVPKTDETDMPA